MIIELPEVAASIHMDKVIWWQNDMVMVFDDKGEQMPEYQGPFLSAYHKIKHVFRYNWYIGDWSMGSLDKVI